MIEFAQCSKDMIDYLYLSRFRQCEEHDLYSHMGKLDYDVMMISVSLQRLTSQGIVKFVGDGNIGNYRLVS